MKTNVSTLLREFPKIRRAALSGEEVIVVTREGNLKITAEEATARSLIGCMQDEVLWVDDRIDEPTTSDDDWKPSL